MRVHAVNAHRARDSVDCHHLQAHARGGSSVYGIQRSMSTSRVYSLPGLRPGPGGSLRTCREAPALISLLCGRVTVAYSRSSLEGLSFVLCVAWVRMSASRFMSSATVGASSSSCPGPGSAGGSSGFSSEASTVGAEDGEGEEITVLSPPGHGVLMQSDTLHALVSLNGTCNESARSENEDIGKWSGSHDWAVAYWLWHTNPHRVVAPRVHRVHGFRFEQTLPPPPPHCTPHAMLAHAANLFSHHIAHTGTHTHTGKHACTRTHKHTHTHTHTHLRTQGHAGGCSGGDSQHSGCWSA